jgi:hypothetical protein
MLGNLVLDYAFISCREAMKAVLYLHQKPALIFFSAVVNQENMAGYTQSIPPSLTLKKHMHV